MVWRRSGPAQPVVIDGAEVTIEASIDEVAIDQTTPGSTDSVSLKSTVGAGATIGATSDAAITSDATGSLSGKLRGLVKWAFERMPSALGQGTMAESFPVVVASDQASVPTSDAGPHWASVWGVSGVPVTSADMSGGAVAVSDAPTAGEKLVITDILVSSDTALRFAFTEETSGTVIAYVRVPANGTAQITFRGKRKLWTADKKVYCQASASGNVEVLVGYYSEA